MAAVPWPQIMGQYQCGEGRFLPLLSSQCPESSLSTSFTLVRMSPRSGSSLYSSVSPRPQPRSCRVTYPCSSSRVGLNRVSEPIASIILQNPHTEVPILGAQFGPTPRG